MSIGALADAAKISKGHLSSVERGLVGITIGTVVKVAQGFGLPSLYILAFAEDDPSVEVVELIRKLPKEQFQPVYRELKKNAKVRKPAK